MTKVNNSMLDMESIAEDSNITDAIDAGAADAITDTLASEAEAEAGTDNEKLMTPLRVAQAIAAQVEPYEPTGYTPTITGTATGKTWTTDHAHAVYYVCSDGAHRLTFNIRGHFDGNITACNVSITGVVFKSGHNQVVTGAVGGLGTSRAIAVAGAAYVACDFGLSDSVVFLSGDVELNAAPTLP